jgi:glycerophosphoryl diester phosphodiesterase
LAIETKHPTRYGGLVEKQLVDLLARFGWAGRPGPPDSIRQPANLDSPVWVMSFAPTAVRRVRLLAPDIPTVLLLEWPLPIRQERLLPPGVPIAGPGIHLLRSDPSLVERAHARGYRVFVWTVNELSDVDFVVSLGVDTLITDRPHEVIAHLDGSSATN